MGNLKNGTSSLQAAFAILALSFGAVACGGDDGGTKDSGVVITLPDGGTKTPLDSGIGSIDSGFVPTTDGGDAGQVVLPPSDCTPKAGCTCTPTTSLELLNSCTSGPCYPFDNSKLPGYSAGNLPALP